MHLFLYITQCLIFDIENIYYTKVVIEEPRKKKHIPQCVRCQQYGHTRSYCNYAPRCVRCGLAHESSTCIKTRDTPAKCANCKGEHPANYRGCQTLRELRAQKKARHNMHQRVEPPPSFNPNDFPALPQISRNSHPTQQQNHQQRPPVQQQKHHQQPSPPRRPAQNQSTSEHTPQPSAATIGSNRPQSAENLLSPQLFQILNSLQTLIHPLFSLLQQLAQVTQGMCPQNGQ